MCRVGAGHANHMSHKQLMELVLKDPVVRFAVEHLGAQIAVVNFDSKKADILSDTRDLQEHKGPRSQDVYLHQ